MICFSINADKDELGRFRKGHRFNINRERDDEGRFLPSSEVIESEPDDRDLDKLIQLVEKSGYFVTRKPLQRDYTFNLDVEPYDGEYYRIGLVSDTQLGSKFQQLINLYKFYHYCADQDITTILHAGDIIDGMHVYRGQEFEIFLHGADQIRDYVVENYPKVDGITTHLLCGNHDESIYKWAGMDIGLAISKERKDIIHRGFYLASFLIDGTRICLHHGRGAVAYARSYKMQKLALALIEDNNPNPQIVALGHYHCSCILPNYLNTYMIQMPCFQSQTPLMKTLALMPDIAGIIIEFKSFEEGKFEIPKCSYIKYDAIKEDF